MKIVVAVDGSACSTRAVELLGEKTWKNEDVFLVLSIVEPVPQEFGIGYLPPPGASLEDREFEDAAKLAGESAAKLKVLLPNNHVEVKVAHGVVAETICTQAEMWDADLIAMGSHGRKGITHFLLGSVAEEVVKKSPCSVEIFKDKNSVKEAKKAAEKKNKDKRVAV